jgi:putative acyl-CoA dehydrogenase
MSRMTSSRGVNAIWEGSGNVMCLDVLRALGREGAAARALLNRLAAEVSELPGGLEATTMVKETLGRPDAEARARIAVEKLALVAAASALAARGPREVAEAFARTRLAERSGPIYGATQLTNAEIDMLIERALPARSGD